jgi:FeS assembly SUF system protein
MAENKEQNTQQPQQENKEQKSNAQDLLKLEAEIIKALKEIYDPEIPVNVYDLGLIYRLDIDENNNVEIDMTLTAPNCPIADQIFMAVQDRISRIPGVNKVVVNPVFDPPWNFDMMSEEAKLQLGYL